MKFLALIALFCCSAAFAAPTVQSTDATTEAIVEPIAASTSDDTAADLNVNASFRQYCEAHTYCYNGRRISCTSSGGSCTSRESAHRWVECVAYDYPGYRGGSRRSWDRCP